MRIWDYKGQGAMDVGDPVIEVAHFDPLPEERGVSISRHGRKWVQVGMGNPDLATFQFYVGLDYRRTRRQVGTVVSFQVREDGDELHFHGVLTLEPSKPVHLVAGQVRWFLEETGVVLPDTRDPLLDQILTAAPVPGELFVSPTELSVYEMLGQPAPMYWGLMDLLPWLEAGSDLEVIPPHFKPEQ